MWWSVGDGGIYYLAKAATPLNHTTLHYSNVIIHIVSLLVHYIKEGLATGSLIPVRVTSIARNTAIM